MGYKEVFGFNGRYLVSEDGMVVSIRKLLDGTNKIVHLHPKLDKDGYFRVSLSNGSRNLGHSTFGVHRLVASAFVPNPMLLPCVNHRDGNKQNNHCSNLEWVSVRENTLHAWRNGLCRPYDRSLPYKREGIILSNKRRSKSL